MAKEVEHGLASMDQLVEKIVECYSSETLLILRLDEQDDLLPGMHATLTSGIQSYWLTALIETGAYKTDPRLKGIKKSINCQSWQDLFKREKANMSDFVTCNASEIGLVAMQEIQGQKTLCSLGFAEDVHLHEAMPDMDELACLLHDLFLKIDRQSITSLSKDEKEVFIYAVLGKTIAESADLLDTSVSYIERARENIQDKFEVETFDQAILAAKKMGFIES